MSYLAVDLALFELLTGAPLDSQGRPQLSAGVPVNRTLLQGPEKGGGFGPSYGLRIPLLKNPQREFPGLSTQRPDAIRLFDKGFEPNAFKQVPVFDDNIEGRDFQDAWPCVTFRYYDLSFDGSVSPFHDPFQSPYGAEVSLKNRYGEVIQTGQAQVQMRKHPESWPVTYMIRVYAKSTIEVMLIEHAIRNLLPARTTLLVPFADGTSHPCDVSFEGYENLDSMGNELRMPNSPQESRYYSRAFLYKIEAYVDNTTNSFGTQDIMFDTVIYQRVLEMDQMMGALAVVNLGDVNAMEYTPITV